MDSEKIKAIKDWPTPTSVTAIRSFLGLFEYDRKFIEKFLRIAYPMTDLRKKVSSYGLLSVNKVFEILSSF